MNLALVLTQNFDPNNGGVQRTTSKLAKIFEDNNHKVIIISFGQHSSTKVDTQGTQLFYVNQKEEFRLKEILHDNDINCIINQIGFSVSLTKTLLRSKPSETKLINTLRINPLNFFDNYNNILQHFFDRKKIGFLDTVITRRIVLGYHIVKQNLELYFIVKHVSAFVLLSEKFISELFFLVPSIKQYQYKIHGIANPFILPEINIINTMENKQDVILFVGRLNILQKRVDLLLSVWKELHNNLPHWQFWVVGEGEDKVYMEKFCKDNLLNRVTFFGKADPTEYYLKAKILHMTSAFEGFGNVLVEAQSYGCVPVLFNSYSAAKDIIIHNENGILIDPFHVETYINQTVELSANARKLSKLGINGYNNVKRFSFERTYKKWNSIFKQL